jgi:hypothetical protein
VLATVVLGAVGSMIAGVELGSVVKIDDAGGEVAGGRPATKAD